MLGVVQLLDRRMGRRTRGWSAARLLFVSAILFGLHCCVSSTSNGKGIRKGHDRKLLESELENYPDGAFQDSQLSSGAILLHTVGFFYMFAALAIVCDEFFVPALEVISETLNLQDDVAGATFMAAGGSAPELATSFVGTFVSRSNVGFGTIVGSAVFNILFVIGACAMFAPGDLKLSAWPLGRDSLYYALCLGVLIACFFDKQVKLYEAVILFLLYIGYVTMMSFNRSLKRMFGVAEEDDEGMAIDLEMVKGQGANVHENKKKSLTLSLPTMHGDASIPSMPSMNRGRSTDSTAALKEGDINKVEDHKITGTHLSAPGQHQQKKSPRKSPRFHFGLHNYFSSQRQGESPTGELPPRLRWKKVGKTVILMNRGKETARRMSSSKATMSDVVLLTMAAPYLEKEEVPLLNLSVAEGKNGETIHHTESDDEEEDDGPMDLAWPSSTSKRISYVLLAPLTFLLYYTVPDVRREGSRNKFPLTFIMSVLWIAFFSYLMVWWATVVGVTLGIPSEIMGLTILAIGTSVPDLLESIIVTKDGKGDMAISSSIGSNIFDVTVGLPLPWIIYTASNGTSIEVGTSGLLISVLLLFAMLLSCILAIAINKWRMTKALGWLFFVLWVIFVGVSLAVTLT
mmetsp:Transcript_13213/g.19755  ORF Transcript_13213/g.19755 Transcript_13213/m.19755 type:complete len:629 (-) Transcript_13213:252-2138(-)